ncbi:MAG: flavin reductase family protein [Fusobacteriota bacterium]
MSSLKTISPEDLKESTFKKIGKEWMLISTKDGKKVNTMTASWGGFGVLWHKNVCFIFVRPQRYTYELLENSNYFTLSFFNEDKRDVLNYCGSVSGKNEDKISKIDLEKVEEDNFLYFKEANTVIKCKKLYYTDINPDNFIEKEIDEFYKKGDYHRMYVGEIIECQIK